MNIEMEKLLPVVENYELQFALEELYKCERDVTAHYRTCMDRLIQIAGAFGFRLGREPETDESMYEAIHNAIKIFKFIPIEKLRWELSRELTKSKPDKLHMRTIAREAIGWQSFVGAVKTPNSKGNPFILYAASKHFKIPIHVISAISGELYSFYPDMPREEYFFFPFHQMTLKARRERLLPHICIGHVYRKYYVSLYLYPRTEHEDSLQSEDTLISIEKLRKEKKDVETQLLEIRDELRSVKQQLGRRKPKAQRDQRQQIDFMKEKMQAIELEKGGKDQLLKAQNEQLKYYEQMLKKSQEEAEQLRRQLSLVTIDRLHREKYFIESELGQIKHELKKLKVEKDSDSVPSKSKNNPYQKQIQQLKDQLAIYEKERQEKDDLVKSHNEQLQSYEQMLKKSMDETKMLRQYIEERDELLRKEFEEKTAEQNRYIEDFMAQSSDRISGASIQAVNTWDTGSGKTNGQKVSNGYTARQQIKQQQQKSLAAENNKRKAPANNRQKPKTNR